jgi:hypothetical protein
VEYRATGADLSKEIEGFKRKTPNLGGTLVEKKWVLA